jgi:hydroxymethylpyrimidine/phosphomethylpyrimidine kinase
MGTEETLRQKRQDSAQPFSKIARALTIAGSDSGGGAGIQADLKTFAALQVHGMSAITAITAQNTVQVTNVHDIPVDVVKAQIEAVIDDIGVDAAKTGMLHTSEIIRTVTEVLGRHSIPVVVDPVMVTKSGAKLLQENAIESLKNILIPTATVVTPNALEAEILAGMEIHNPAEAKHAAKRIAELGPRAVIVKGGHIPSETKVVDTLYFEGAYHEYGAEHVSRNTDHGTGCSFSAAITAELAKGRTIPEAVNVARNLITSAIRHGIKVGKGHGPVNPMSQLYRKAEKFEVLSNLRKAIGMLEANSLSYRLIPESQSNIAMSLREPESLLDVAAVAGRIVKIGSCVKASAAPEFGASRHVASAIIAAMRYDATKRSAMNVVYVPDLLKVCKALGLTVSHYDRSQEPRDVKEKEGGTIPWGTEQAIMRINRVPDVVYHTGDYGKEPMAAVFGKSAVEVAETALKIAEALVTL